MQTQSGAAKSILAFGSGALLGFGAGFALRAAFPKSSQFMTLLLAKLGFEVGDLLLMVWDPEPTHHKTLPPPRTLPMELVSPIKKKRKKATGRKNGKVVVQASRRRNPRSREVVSLN